MKSKEFLINYNWQILVSGTVFTSLPSIKITLLSKKMKHFKCLSQSNEVI